MKILLFGGSGQLGQEFVIRARDLSFEVTSPVIADLDITDEKQVRFLAEKVKPQAILNFAAYTAVDAAETESELCYRVNRDGAKNCALAAKDVGAKLVHISTDYVFAGKGDVPLDESAPANALSVYGKSKAAGEEACNQVLGGKELIVRTSSLHGRYGANFVHTMLKLFDEGKSVSVVSDQIMSPTWAGFLAEVLLDLLRLPASGVLHVSCKGALSWLDFAKAVAREAGLRPEILPTTAEELKRPAPRPSYSVFNLTKLEALLGRPAMEWQKGLINHLKDIGRYKGGN